MYESLTKLGSTKKMMEAYSRLDFTNDFEGIGDVFVDYHGAVQDISGMQKGVDVVEKK